MQKVKQALEAIHQDLYENCWIAISLAFGIIPILHSWNVIPASLRSYTHVLISLAKQLV